MMETKNKFVNEGARHKEGKDEGTKDKEQDKGTKDRNGKSSAPDSFVRAVLTQLVSVIYKPGETIIPARSPVRDLVFIVRGTCKLYGFYHKKGDKKELIKLTVVRLR